MSHEPVNGVGATEREWNEWKAAMEAWQRANPVPRHTPAEVCTCEDIPVRTGKAHGHCAARGPIVDWEPSFSRNYDMPGQ